MTTRLVPAGREEFPQQGRGPHAPRDEECPADRADVGVAEPVEEETDHEDAKRSTSARSRGGSGPAAQNRLRRAPAGPARRNPAPSRPSRGYPRAERRRGGRIVSIVDRQTAASCTQPISRQPDQEKRLEKEQHEVAAGRGRQVEDRFGRIARIVIDGDGLAGRVFAYGPLGIGVVAGGPARKIVLLADVMPARRPCIDT